MMNRKSAFMLASLVLSACTAQEPEVLPAETSAAPKPAPSQLTLDDWVGVYSSTEEIAGFSGTVLVISKSSDGADLDYRKKFYSDSPRGMSDDIRQDEFTGQCLVDGNRIYIPEASGYYMKGKGPRLSARIERYTRTTINDRIVLLRDDAWEALQTQNELYDYGVLVRVAAELDDEQGFDGVKHESIKVLYIDESKPWADPFVNGPNER